MLIIEGHERRSSNCRRNWILPLVCAFPHSLLLHRCIDGARIPTHMFMFLHMPGKMLASAPACLRIQLQNYHPCTDGRDQLHAAALRGPAWQSRAGAVLALTCVCVDAHFRHVLTSFCEQRDVHKSVFIRTNVAVGSGQRQASRCWNCTKPSFCKPSTTGLSHSSNASPHQPSVCSHDMSTCANSA